MSATVSLWHFLTQFFCVRNIGETLSARWRIPKEQRKSLCHHSPPQCDETSSAQPGNTPFREGIYVFYRKRRELSHNSGILHLADKVSPTFHTQKNGFKNATVTQWRKTTTLCPVHIWAEIIIRLDSYSGTTRDTPVNTVWAERHKTTINSQMTTNSLREGKLSFSEERLGFSHKEVGTHSIRSESAMELYLDKVNPETIMIMGR